MNIRRNTVKLCDQAIPAQGMDTDTVALGPLLVSAGLAYTSALGGPMRFLFEVNSIAGIPVIDEFACADPDDPGTCVHPREGCGPAAALCAAATGCSRRCARAGGR